MLCGNRLAVTVELRCLMDRAVFSCPVFGFRETALQTCCLTANLASARSDQALIARISPPIPVSEIMRLILQARTLSAISVPTFFKPRVRK